MIGKVGGCFGDAGVSIQSIVQFNASEAGAEIVVITHEVSQRKVIAALDAITALDEVSGWRHIWAAFEARALPSGPFSVKIFYREGQLQLIHA